MRIDKCYLHGLTKRYAEIAEIQIGAESGD